MVAEDIRGMLIERATRDLRRRIRSLAEDWREAPAVVE